MAILTRKQKIEYNNKISGMHLVGPALNNTLVFSKNSNEGKELFHTDAESKIIARYKTPNNQVQDIEEIMMLTANHVLVLWRKGANLIGENEYMLIQWNLSNHTVLQHPIVSTSRVRMIVYS